MPQHLRSDNTYNEDFAYEGEIEPLLCRLILLYMRYELIVAEEVSNAAVNITRQNTTKESLKKIDEREEMRAMLQLKENREKEFGKVLDNYTKLNSYQEAIMETCIGKIVFVSELNVQILLNGEKVKVRMTVPVLFEGEQLLSYTPFSIEWNPKYKKICYLCRSD